MREKFELFSNLPLEIIKHEIPKYLPSNDLSSLGRTSKFYWQLFKPMLFVNKFLYHLVRRDDDIVEKMLRSDINLILTKGCVRDWSGREFPNISGFEYFVWAADKSGWTMLLNHLPQDENRKLFLKKILNQYHKVTQEGITYIFNGETITEKHFDFTGIKNALKTYLEFYNDKEWIKIGVEQRKLPIHLFYDFSSNYHYDIDGLITRNNDGLRVVSSIQLAKDFVDPKVWKDWDSGYYSTNWFAEDSTLGHGVTIVDKEMMEDDSFCGRGGHIKSIINSYLVTIDIYYCITIESRFAKLKSELEHQISAADIPSNTNPMLSNM